MLNDDSKVIYENIIIKVEKYSEIFNLAFVKVTMPISMFPHFFLSYFAYFTTDAGNDAFRLPFLEWFDKINYYALFKYNLVLLLIRIKNSQNVQIYAE